MKSVQLSIQRNGSGWWGGGAFDQPSESFRTALTSSERDSTRWSYALQLPADGLYTVHVRATDGAATRRRRPAQASAQFTIDTTPPPAPAITARPDATTTARSATFAFADAEPGVRLLCRRDGRASTACTSPQSYASLSLGSHRFEAEAIDAAGNTSSPAGYAWTIAKTVETSGKPFTVTGNASGPARAGRLARAGDHGRSTPTACAIEVTALTVSVAAGSTNAGMRRAGQPQVTQPNISSANPLTVAANGSVALPAGAVSAPRC